MEVNEDTPDLCCFLFQIRPLSCTNAADRTAEEADLLRFVDVLKGMLQLDAAQRITPHQVLEHEFTSMKHMVRMCHLSS